MQAAQMEVLLCRLQAAVGRGALNRRVLAVQHDVVVDIDALIDPIAASFCVWALDHQLVQHSLDDPGHRADVLVRLDRVSARRTRPPAAWLRAPGMIEALAAKVVLARELDRLIKGRMADQADEVAVWLGDVLEVLDFGRDLDDSAVSTLR